MKRLSLIIGFVLLTQITRALPCSEIQFVFMDAFPTEVLDDDLTILWEYNKLCTDYEKRSDNFVIKLMSIFEDVILVDTIKGFHFTIMNELLDSSGITLFNVKELGDDVGAEIALRTKKDFSSPQHFDEIEKINFCLLNGYFLNALSMIEKLEEWQLIEDIKTQYIKLFPQYYPRRKNFFNGYFNDSLELHTMPFIKNTKSLLKKLNNPINRDKKPFFIELIVSAKNEIKEVKVSDSKYQNVVLKAINEIEVYNSQSNQTFAFIKIGTSKNKKKFVLSNKRALTDPRSIWYKKKFWPRGAIH